MMYEVRESVSKQPPEFYCGHGRTVLGSGEIGQKTPLAQLRTEAIKGKKAGLCFF